MNPHGPLLDARQIKAAELVFQLGSVRAAAELVGVDESTVREWAKRPAWAEYMQGLEARARETSSDRAIELLREAQPRAAEVLVEILNKPEEKSAERIRAAVAVLDRTGVGPHSFQHDSNALDAMSTAELEQRLLEEADAIRAKRSRGEA